MDLYIMRHGQTDYNVASIYNGLTEDVLNETGLAQARMAGERLKDLHLDRILCSPLIRTRQTCELANINQVPVEYEPLLVERDMGNMIGMPYSAINQQESWKLDSDYLLQYPGVEHPAHVLERAQKIIEKVKQSYPGEAVLLITHGGLMRALRAAVEGIPESRNLRDYKLVDNCTLLHYIL